MVIGLLARLVRIGGRFENDPLGILWHLFPKNPCRFVTVPKRNEPKRRSLGQEKGIRLLEEIDKTEAEEYEVLRESEQRREVREKRGYERGHAAVLNPNPPPEAPPSSSSIRFSLHSALLLDFGCTNYPTPLGHNINSWLNPPSQRHPGPGLALWSSLTSASQMMRRNRPPTPTTIRRNAPHANVSSAESTFAWQGSPGLTFLWQDSSGSTFPWPHRRQFGGIDVPVATPTAIRRNRRSRGHTDVNPGAKILADVNPEERGPRQRKSGGHPRITTETSSPSA